MIRVVAFDLDGTLLNSRHEVSEETLKAIRDGAEKGIRFIAITGRSFQDTLKSIDSYQLPLDYIVASGAEIRSRDKKLLKQVPMIQDDFPGIVNKIKKFPVAIRFCSNEYDYMLGTREEIKEYALTEAQCFHSNLDREELLRSDEFLWSFEKIRQINNLYELKRQNIDVYKIYVFSEDPFMIADIDDELLEFENIASASSFENNLELTHVEAQKGRALRSFIEHRGYKMDEVMCIGDSMNDFSMLSMKFGATVVMENGMDKVKRVAKYITKSNNDDGVAHAIRFALGEAELMDNPFSK